MIVKKTTVWIVAIASMYFVYLQSSDLKPAGYALLTHVDHIIHRRVTLDPHYAPKLKLSRTNRELVNTMIEACVSRNLYFTHRKKTLRYYQPWSHPHVPSEAKCNPQYCHPATLQESGALIFAIKKVRCTPGSQADRVQRALLLRLEPRKTQ